MEAAAKARKQNRSLRGRGLTGQLSVEGSVTGMTEDEPDVVQEEVREGEEEGVVVREDEPNVVQEEVKG